MIKLVLDTRFPSVLLGERQKIPERVRPKRAEHHPKKTENCASCDEPFAEISGHNNQILDK